MLSKIMKRTFVLEKVSYTVRSVYGNRVETDEKLITNNSEEFFNVNYILRSKMNKNV